MRLNIDGVEAAMARIGVNQYDVAKRLDRYPSSVSRLLAKIRAGESLSPRLCANLARALEVDLADITEVKP
jgi:hypothetical protein